jgi:hypothetical protein
MTMSTRSHRTLALASAVMSVLLLGSPKRAAADCAWPSVESGGIYTFIGSGKNFTITIVNLTDYLLYNSGTVRAGHWNQSVADRYEAPFGWGAHSYTRPVQVVDMNGDSVLEAGIPPYRSLTWKAADPPDVYVAQHYYGELDLELRGYTDSAGKVLPTPSWPNKFLVYFHPQDPESGAGQGTWISLRPDHPSDWYGYNLFRSGGWTTPRFPGNVTYQAPGEMEMRNITTIANQYLVATLYSTDSLNIVIVVRQTNWAAGKGVPSDTDPVAGMDAYDARRLDWVENGSDRVPRYSGCNQ